MPVRTYALAVALMSICFSCKKSDDNQQSAAKINFIFKFDSTQARLNAVGAASVMPIGNAGQSPRFNSMTAHYLELAKDQFTLLGAGAVLYHAPEVATGGETAIDFAQSNPTGNNQVFLSIPVSSLAAGTYNWLRVSLAYQNYNVYMQIPGQTVDATIASFIGFNTYIGSSKIKDSTVAINANKKQGYWALEASAFGIGTVRSGQAPPGATTVPNPLSATSPIPAGSCVVTGQLASPLVVTGTETSDINIQISLSTNKSFEWKDVDGNGTYDPINGDLVVDMGIRGMIPKKL